jgi:hypothetical protein
MKRGVFEVRVVLMLTALAALAACSTPAPKQLQTGQDEAQVQAAMGPPTGRYALPGGGTRLEFANGPAGRFTWMVDLSAAGRVTAKAQVLDAEHFDQVQAGMRADELLRLLGRPAARQREWMDKQTWSWRYDTRECFWFSVTLDAQGVVMGGGSHMVDPACDVNTSR